MGNRIAQQISKEGVIDVVPISENHTDLSDDAIIKDFLDSFEIIQIIPSETKDTELIEIKSHKSSEPILIPIPTNVTQLHHHNKRGKKKHRKGGTRF
jgi:hypothetical protein